MELLTGRISVELGDGGGALLGDVDWVNEPGDAFSPFVQADKHDGLVVIELYDCVPGAVPHTDALVIEEVEGTPFRDEGGN